MKFFGEPLFHFLAIGAGLFLLFDLVDDSDGYRQDRIMVGAGQIERLTESWTRLWQQQPTAEELEGLIQDYIREEIYYREALAMGLDRDDTIVRRRLRQKVEFLTEDIVAVDPTEEQLRSYFDRHPEDFRLPARLSFEHVYLNPDRRGPAITQDIESLLVRLKAGNLDNDAARLGDILFLPARFEGVSESELAKLFGKDFSGQLVKFPVGQWMGPVTSGFGLHIVRLGALAQARIPSFEAARERVERDWDNAHRQSATEAFYQELRARYKVTVTRTEGTDDENAMKVSKVYP